MLEPQGTLFFLLLMGAFAGLLVWLVLTKQVVFRVLAACLAFIPAMVFGIAAVNKYYDYYQTWSALINDLSGQTSSIPTVTAASLGPGSAKSVRAVIAGTDPAIDAKYGLLFRTTVKGPSSHITRQVYIYLPPQYFMKHWASYKFPGILLLHGSPGQPATWVNAMDLLPIYQGLLASGKARPAVLVMPDTDGGQQYGLQCLNDPHGLQDMTYVAKEVPTWVAANLRVEKPSIEWGVAGYSEGGYCAANIGLQNATRFGFVGVLSGYFAPEVSRVPLGGKPNGAPHSEEDFAHNPHLAMINSPQQYIQQYPIGIEVPQFFLAAGSNDRIDVQRAQTFRQLLLSRVADVPLVIVSGGGHGALTWRDALTPMLTWMTTNLAWEVQHFSQQALYRAEAAKRQAEERAHEHRPPATHTPTARPTPLSFAPGSVTGKPLRRPGIAPTACGALMALRCGTLAGMRD